MHMGESDLLSFMLFSLEKRKRKNHFYAYDQKYQDNLYIRLLACLLRYWNLYSEESKMGLGLGC